MMHRKEGLHVTNPCVLSWRYRSFVAGCPLLASRDQHIEREILDSFSRARLTINDILSKAHQWEPFIGINESTMI